MIKFFRKIRKNLLNEGKTTKYFKYAIGEIVLVVIGILIAFQINNWNENRKNKFIESKILSEISNGLHQDLADIKLNVYGHDMGLKAIEYWRGIIENKTINNDSLSWNYHYLTRDFLSGQNTSGYESLKSKGLEYIQSDSIRVEIIMLYEQLYPFLRKLEEEYEEAQFQKSYFKEINHLISPHLNFNEVGLITSINSPINLNATNKKLLLSYLWKIKNNRQFVVKQYHLTETKVNSLLEMISKELNN